MSVLTKCLNPKKYWTLSKSFYNGKKVLLISPILKGNKYVSDFKEKTNYFNEFFSLQCSPVVNSSVLPDKLYQPPLLNQLPFVEVIF